MCSDSRQEVNRLVWFAQCRKVARIKSDGGVISDALITDSVVRDNTTRTTVVILSARGNYQTATFYRRALRPSELLIICDCVNES